MYSLCAISDFPPCFNFTHSINGVIKTNTTETEIELNGSVINEHCKDHYIDIVPHSNTYNIGGMNLKDCTLHTTQITEKLMYGTEFPKENLKQGRLFFKIKEQG